LIVARVAFGRFLRFPLFHQSKGIRLQGFRKLRPVLFAASQHLFGVVEHKARQAQLGGNGQGPALARLAHHQTEGGD